MKNIIFTAMTASALLLASSAWAYPPEDTPENSNAPRCAPGQINKSINSVMPGVFGEAAQYIQMKDGNVGEVASGWAALKQDICEVGGEKF